MRIHLEALGCRLNYAEMTALGRRLLAAGYELAASADQADLCVLNSCAVTGEAARKSRQLARQIACTNPSARLIVTGCYATLEAEVVEALPNVALVVGNAGKDELLTLIEGERQRSADEGRKTTVCLPHDGLGQAQASIVRANPQPLRPTPSATDSVPAARTRAFVKVQDGCRNRCTFCIIAVARGDERSRSISEVVEEVSTLREEGYQEVVLAGVHLGAYGRGQGVGLASLVCALLEGTQIPRLRLSSLEPFDLDPGFFDLWAQSNGRLMPHLHLPAQSGSNRLLRRMARHNRVEDFEVLVELARARIPGITITTDLITGFPGERESDFEETVAFARRVGFAHMHIFPYSAREGTAAARFNEQVPATERRRRSRVLCELDAELRQTVLQSFVNQTRPVLWERPSADATRIEFLEHDLSLGCLGGSVLWSGLTDNYLRVLTLGPAGVDLHNRIATTKLTRVVGCELLGELIGQ
jgi:threonylcarbamoyladenosine tRNA methylthiotransferase MtaB